MSSTAHLPRQLRKPQSGSEEKRGVALASLLAAAGMALLKLVAGLWTGSLGMLSEAAHSGIDCSAALLTLMSVRVSDKPADADHPYGHGKIENVSAFVQTLLMVASAVWISAEAIKRLWHHQEPLRLSVWPFAVLLLSVAVDVSRARKLNRTAQKHGSAALAADAAHFSTDVLTSIAVLVGLVCVWAAKQYAIPMLAYADSVAAIVVAIVILGISWKLARPAVDQLLDVVPQAERSRIIEELATVPGVLSIDRVRLRKSGTRFYADISLGMARTLTFQRSEQLVRDATLAVQRVLPESDVVVTPLPRASRAESIFDRVRAVASRHNVSVHDLSVQDFDGSLRAELHLEVIESMPLREAHDFVSGIEVEIQRECPELASVLTHIESEPAQIEHPQTVERNDALEAALRSAAGDFPQIEDVHDVTVRRVGEHTYVSCHCTLPDEMPMSEVHAIITDLEGIFKLNTPTVTRVFIHPEPATDNRR
jgi:cation diffusion facilitator family transporter